jgi:hypothetical protein
VSADRRMGVSAFAEGEESRLDVFLSISGMSEKVTFCCGRLVRRVAGLFGLVRVLLLGSSLLLGACTEGNTGGKDKPVIYGNAAGDGGGGGATGGMSFSW